MSESFGDMCVLCVMCVMYNLVDIAPKNKSEGQLSFFVDSRGGGSRAGDA